MKISDGFVQIGSLGVDSGTVMVGDPSYTLPDKRFPPKGQQCDYVDFLNVLDDGNVWTPWGDAGMPLIISTRDGDGSFPVYVRLGSNGRPAQILIDFEGESEEEDEDECVCEHCGATIDSLELSVNNGFCDTCASDQSFYYCSDCQCDISFSMWRDNDGYCDDCAAANE